MQTAAPSPQRAQATSFLQRRPRELLYCKTPSDALPDLFGLVNEVEFFSKIRITDYFLELTRSFRTNLVIQDFSGYVLQ
jgi:hypothetical protein